MTGTTTTRTPRLLSQNQAAQNQASLMNQPLSQGGATIPQYLVAAQVSLPLPLGRTTILQYMTAQQEHWLLSEATVFFICVSKILTFP